MYRNTLIKRVLHLLKVVASTHSRFLLLHFSSVSSITSMRSAGFFVLLCVLLVHDGESSFRPISPFSFNHLAPSCQQQVASDAHDLVADKFPIMQNIMHVKTDMDRFTLSVIDLFSGKVRCVRRKCSAMRTKLRTLRDKLSAKSGTKQNGQSFDSSDKAFMSSVHADNEKALKALLDISESNDSWTFVGESRGVRVEKCFLAAGSYVDPIDAVKGGKHACVKSSGIVNAPPEKVYKLFLDNTRVREYNEHCKEVQDVYYFPRNQPNCWTKISYAFSPAYGPFKARDFCSIVHVSKGSKNDYIIMNRPAYLSNYSSNKKFVRATILLAGNIIQPHGNQQTKITMIAHVNPGGGADTKTAAFFINKLCAKGPPDFIRKLEAAAMK